MTYEEKKAWLWRYRSAKSFELLRLDELAALETEACHMTQRYSAVPGCSGDGQSDLSNLPTIDLESLPPQWRKTAECPPKAEDTDPRSATVLTVQVGIGFVTAWEWHIVADFPEEFPVWMPMPKLPGEIGE